MNNDEKILKQLLANGLTDKRLEQILRTIMTDGEQALSANDFDYYCGCLPEIIRLMQG